MGGVFWTRVWDRLIYLVVCGPFPTAPLLKLQLYRVLICVSRAPVRRLLKAAVVGRCRCYLFFDRTDELSLLAGLMTVPRGGFVRRYHVSFV